MLRSHFQHRHACRSQYLRADYRQRSALLDRGGDDVEVGAFSGTREPCADVGKPHGVRHHTRGDLSRQSEQYAAVHVAHAVAEVRGYRDAQLRFSFADLRLAAPEVFDERALRVRLPCRFVEVVDDGRFVGLEILLVHLRRHIVWRRQPRIGVVHASLGEVQHEERAGYMREQRRA